MSENKKATIAEIKNTLAPKQKLIVALGIIGAVLIALSSFLPSSKAKPNVGSSGTMSAQEYTQQLEQRILDIVSSIEGAGQTKVLITLENSAEYVYAQQQRITTDNTESIQNDNTKVDEKSTSENTYIFVENENGRKQALIETVVEPRIKGVVILCEGAGNSQVEYRVLNAVTTALNISSTKVCITKISR